MEIYTDNWFKYLREEVLTEGLRDIGLPEFVIDYLEDAMPDASEKAKVYIAKNWKESIGGMAGAYTPNNLKYEIVSYLIDNALRDYVQAPGDKVDQEPVARTITPFSVGEPERKREMYDEERLKQNEQVKFVIINLRNTVGRPMGTWRKAFMKAVKALSKAGLPSEKVESIKEYLRSLYNKNFHYWLNKYSELVDFLNDDATNYEMIKGVEDINEAEKIAIQYLENKEDPEFIMHVFDDGSYWYNLDVSSCDVEASRMGHCGSDSRGVLVSLRKRKDKRRESSSYVTMTWDAGEQTIWQIKGRSNDAPPSETWHHIAWFINNMDIETVHETGEHSNDYDGFIEMNDWLSMNTTAEFPGSRESRLEAAEQYCENVDQRFYDQRDELEQASISWDVPEDDWNNEVYINMSADYTFEIDLGWTDIEDTDEGGAPPDPQDFTPIPTNWSDRNSWESDMNIDDMMWAMPGDDGEVETELVMLIGAQPEYEDIVDDMPATAHLRVRCMTHGTATVDEDGEVPEYDSWADSMLEFENDAPEHIEDIRQQLAAAGHIARTAYDKSKEGLESLTDLDKWHVKRERGGLEFDWTAEDGQPLHYYPAPLPPEAQMYGMGTGNVMGRADASGIFREIFGYGQTYRFANLAGMIDVSISRAFSEKLGNAVSNSLRTTAKGQEEFDFGDKYKTVDPTKALADDTDFVIFNQVRWDPDNHPNSYPTIKIAWLYRMRVGPRSAPEEFEIIKDIAEYLNEKPELVTQAANETIASYVDSFMEKINRRQEKVLDNQEIQRLINHAKEVYGGVLDQYSSEEGDSPRGHSTADIARKVWHIVTWFEDRYNDMDEIERYVMLVHWLGPIAGNTFHTYGAKAEIDNDTGAPTLFDDLVQQQRKAMRRQTPKARNFQTPRGETLPGRMGEPRPAQESVEHQIARIERLLAEATQDTRPAKEPTPFKSKAQKRYKRSRKKNSKMYNMAGHKNLKTGSPYVNKGKRAGTDRLRFEEVDVRLYKMQLDAIVSAARARGGSKLLQDELRSIEGVTVISVEESRDLTTGADFTRFNIKFSLMGQTPRVGFVEERLLPALRRVEGFDVKDWSIPVEVTPGKKLRESSMLSEIGFPGFGGLAGNLGAQRYSPGAELPTPRMTLQAIIDDWVEGGVMAYDAPMDTTDMRYSVMMPVSELTPFTGRYYRGDAQDFEGRYQQFIRNGPVSPVYVAIGMNGRVKITGNEDLVWFAKKSGLEEVPVFLSYQKQV